jgi:hypothetical protein
MSKHQRGADEQATAPKYIYEYKFLVLEGVMGTGDVITPVNDLAAEGWRVMSFEYVAGTYQVLMERVT